jgi:hypothetical protein
VSDRENERISTRPFCDGLKTADSLPSEKMTGNLATSHDKYTTTQSPPDGGGEDEFKAKGPTNLAESSTSPLKTIQQLALDHFGSAERCIYGIMCVVVVDR